MELKEYLNKYRIIGIVADYQNHLDGNMKVKEIITRRIDKSLKLVNLNDDIKEKLYKELDLCDQIKIDLISKINEDVIIIGNLSKNLNYKDQEFIKKILIKLVDNYNKKVVMIDSNIEVMMGFIRYYFVLQQKKIVYKTNNVFDDRLYEFVKMPRIISFIKLANMHGANLSNNTDIHELIKEIYRSVS